MQRLIDYVAIFISFFIKLILWAINLGNMISTTCQTQSFTQASKVFTPHTVCRTWRSQIRTGLDTFPRRTRFHKCLNILCKSHEGEKSFIILPSDGLCIQQS